LLIWPIRFETFFLSDSDTGFEASFVIFASIFSCVFLAVPMVTLMASILERS
jgi:hypothetical protein